MTKLELCQRLAKEAGISSAQNGTSPVSTTNQVGELLSVVQWVDDAYEDIQNKHTDWLFLTKDFSFNTTAGTSVYTPAAASLPEHQMWCDQTLRAYLTASGFTDEQWLRFSPWEDFRDDKLFGANRTLQSRVTDFSIKPDLSLVFWPTPDNIYSINGEYMQRAQVMDADADVPVFPRQFHMAIVWHALILYAGFESSSAVYAHAEKERDRLMTGLERNQLPAIGTARSLV